MFWLIILNKQRHNGARSHEFQLGAMRASQPPPSSDFPPPSLRFTSGNRCKRLIASSQTIFDRLSSFVTALTRWCSHPLTRRSWEGCPQILAGITAKATIEARWDIRRSLGCVNPASWLPLATWHKFTQPRAHFIAQNCTLAKIILAMAYRL